MLQDGEADAATSAFWVAQRFSAAITEHCITTALQAAEKLVKACNTVEERRFSAA
jgi:hypothetical protein